MTTFIKSKAVKAVVGLLAIAVIFGGIGFKTKTADAACTTYTFGTGLYKYGSSSTYVKEIQQFLNANGFTVSTSGTGSAGFESMYFGTKTKAAVMAFQAAKGLVADGYYGSLSRAAMLAMQANNCSGNPVPQTGPVTAMLSTDNPATGTIVAGQATADLMHITFTGSGTVTSVTLSRGGISDQNTLSNIYLYDGVTRLTDGYSFNTNGTLTMNNLNIMVNGSKTIAVKADVYSSTTSYDVFVTLSSFTAGTSVSTVSIKGNDMFIAGNGSLATIAYSGSNTVSSGSVNAGTTSYAVWRQAFQVNTRTLSLKAANFRITGSAPSDALQNVGLYVDGLKVGGNAMMTMTNGSNYLSFDFTSMPYSLTTGTHTFEVRGDIVKGSSYNFIVSLQQASDIMVMDPQVGVNLAITSFTTSSGGTISIGTGSFTATIDPTFSTMTNVTAAASNVPIARFKLHAYGEDVKVTSLPITTVLSGSTPAASGLQNVTLYFNGSQVGTQLSQAIGLNTFTLGSQMILPAGMDSILEVRADLRTTGGTNYTAGSISANLGAATAEGWTSHASITGPTATGNVLTMQAGTLGLSANSGYANQNLNPNTAGVKIGSFTLQNQSSAESIRVTSLLVNLAYGAGTSSANLSGLRTSETSGNAGVPTQPATAAASGNANNTFSTDFTLAPGATKTIDIFADSGADNGSTATVISTLTVTSLGLTSNVSATSSATAGQTVTFRNGTLGTPTINSSTSTAAQLIAAGNGGAADGSVAYYTFTSTNASSTITELTFTVTSGTATSVKVNGISAPVIAGTAYLTGLSIAVPTGSGVDIPVYVSYSTVGATGVGIASNTSSTLTLTTVKYTSGSTTTSLTSLTNAAPTMTLVGSKPTVTVNTSINGNLNMGGENKIGEITIAADAKGSIKINDIKFSVSNVGFTTNPTFTLARIADGTTTIAGSSCGQGTAAAASQTIFCEFGTVGNTFTTTTGVASVEVNTDYDGYIIAAGQSKTFSLFATTTAANTGTNLAQISTSLVQAGFNFDDTATAVFVADGSAASPSAGTNLSGSVLYNFPTGAYTIHQ